MGHALSGLGDVLRREGKFGEAEATLRSALDILVQALGEDSSMAQVTLKRFADLYTARGKPAQAAAYTARLKPTDWARGPRPGCGTGREIRAAWPRGFAEEFL